MTGKKTKKSDNRLDLTITTVQRNGQCVYPPPQKKQYEYISLVFLSALFLFSHKKVYFLDLTFSNWNLKQVGR